jgi:hypothetical protein
MRDYLRKQSRQAATGVPEVVASTNPEDPSRYKYKGRFKLNTWSHKNSTKSLRAKRAGVFGKKQDDSVTVEVSELLATDIQVEVRGRNRKYRSPKPVFILNGSCLDPFSSLAVPLGPHSERLLVHCEFATI